MDSTQPALCKELTHKIIGVAFAIHKDIGPGLLESIYQFYLSACLVDAGMSVKQQESVQMEYQGHRLTAPLKADLIVNDQVLVEIKAVETVLPIHKAQALTYMKLLKIPVGLLLNFHVVNMQKGIHRLSLAQSEKSA